MKISVKTLSGKVVSFGVDPLETVERLKQRIEDREAIPLEKQKLQFSGALLDNERTLADYNIQEGSFVQMTFY